jgi:PTH1 family peptidyl-tRNA hydrolase
MKIIVGLGNPGRGYANNRHNIGFICLNHFARAQGRPQTYMNLSGESISRLIKRFDINLNDLLVIHDDLDLPLGKIRIRQGGSSGGHKGIESIVACLGRQDFVRLRVGIGRPTATEDSSEISDADIIAYVLTGFTPDQKQIITTVIPRVREAIYCLLSEGLTAAMNKYN